MPAHIYYTEDALEFGLAESVLLQHIGFWCVTNLAKKQNIHDGNVWTYNPMTAMVDLLPELCPPKDLGQNPTEKEIKKETDRRKKIIERLLKKLIQSGKLITGNYNKSKYDQTKWYAFKNPEDLKRYGSVDENALEALKTLNGQKRPMATTPPEPPIGRNRPMDNPETSNEQDEIVQPIPVTYTDTDSDTDKTTTTTSSTGVVKISLNEFFETVRDQMKGSGVPEWFISFKASDLWFRYEHPCVGSALQICYNDWTKMDDAQKRNGRSVMRTVE